MTYTRPEGKSGGHGVGWSEIPRYTFKVPQGWQESPVSIADLGGTEVRVILTFMRRHCQLLQNSSWHCQPCSYQACMPEQPLRLACELYKGAPEALAMHDAKHCAAC